MGWVKSKLVLDEIGMKNLGDDHIVTIVEGFLDHPPE
jgi:hypothetical protein